MRPVWVPCVAGWPPGGHPSGRFAQRSTVLGRARRVEGCDPDVKVVVLVPRRADNGWRDRLWAHCRHLWELRHPGWPIVEGVAPDGLFNRSAAINTAAAAAGDWDVAVIADSDVIVSPVGVELAVDLADQVGGLVTSHDERVMLNRWATSKVLDGYIGSWDTQNMVDHVWTEPKETASCCIAVPRRLWDAVNGFDPGFVGWGHEDWAFRAACETLSGLPVLRVSTRLYHLWHEVQPTAPASSPTRALNEQRWLKYAAASGNPFEMSLLTGAMASDDNEDEMIPRILHRTIPGAVDPIVDTFWDGFRELHPDWELRSWDEPLNPADFPLTSDLWDLCANGAQKAGLVRLELLVTYGGVYVDSDVEALRPLDPLLRCGAFAGWEDNRHIPDAVLGATPGHPAFVEMLQRARRFVSHKADAWTSGPGVTTGLLPGRDDVLLLPPGSLYPYHYTEKARAGENFRETQPWAFVVHHWHGSWLTPAEKQQLAAKQVL